MKNLLEKLKEKKQKSKQKKITSLLKLKKKMTEVYTIQKYF